VGVCAAELALAVLGVSCEDSLAPLELKLDAFCPVAGVAAGAVAAAGVELGGAGVVVCGVAERL
jgi:hypothetical protein